jgi:hypothetical protein
LADETGTNDEYQWVSVRQAAALLSSSPSSIRRRVRLPDDDPNHLEHELRARPGAQTDAFLVRVPASLGAPPADSDAPADAPPDAPDHAPEEAVAPAVGPDDLYRIVAELGQLWLAPVIDQLAATTARDADRAEMVGLLKARLEMSLARIGEIEGQRDQARSHACDLAHELAEEREARRLAQGAVDRLTQALAELAAERQRGLDGLDNARPAPPWWRRWLGWGRNPDVDLTPGG